MRIFLDANIIADWLLVAPDVLSITEIDKKKAKLEELWKKYSAPKASFEILELLREGKIKNLKFFSSELALSEVGDVVFKESGSRSLAEKGVAFRYIPKMIRETKLSNPEITGILDKVRCYRLAFKDKVILHDKVKDPLFILYTLSFFRIETYDAYLISQAVDAKCRYFVTKDGPLRDNVKMQITKDGIEKYVIKLISPEELLKIINKKRAKIK